MQNPKPSAMGMNRIYMILYTGNSIRAVGIYKYRTRQNRYAGQS